MAARVRDVAELAGVSAATVSNVFNHPEKVSDETIARVRAAISQLDFTRNDAARQLRLGRSRTIGLIVLDMHPFFVDLALGAAEQAEASGYSVLVANTDHDLKRETAYLELFAEQRVHGVLISPTGDFEKRLDRFDIHGIPVVLVDRYDAHRFSSVSVDDVQGGRLAAEHLLAIGRRRLCFVGGPVSIRQVAERLSGASDEVGRVFGARLEVVGVPELTVQAGQAAGKESLPGRANRCPTRSSLRTTWSHSACCKHLTKRTSRFRRKSLWLDTTTSISRRPPRSHSVLSASRAISSGGQPSTSS